VNASAQAMVQCYTLWKLLDLRRSATNEPHGLLTRCHQMQHLGLTSEHCCQGMVAVEDHLDHQSVQC
jgi:hypothetical protein